MKFKQFGNTGEKVFIIGLGTYGFGDAYGGISKEDAFQILNSTIKRLPKQANLLVDTAPRYGNGICEKWIGEFLNKFTGNNILVATKGGRHIDHNRINEKDFSYDFLKADLDNSLERLGGNEIFLYQLHNPSLEILKEGAVFDFLEEFRDAGKIRFYGVSIDSPEEGIAAIDVCRRKGYRGLASIQVIHNILNKAACNRLFKIAKESGVAVIAREPLFRGFLTDKYSEGNRFSSIPPARQKEIDSYGLLRIQQKIGNVKELLQKYQVVEPLSKVAIKFSISHPNVTLAIPGTNRREYVESNLDSANIPLDSNLLSELNGITDIAPPHESEVSTKELSVTAENSNRDAMEMAS